jgi:hypothetical protein
MKRLLVAIFLLGFARAETFSLEQVVQLIKSANREIIVIAPVLRVHAIADMLRWVGVAQGVTIKGVTEAAGACDKASYWESLRQATKMELRAITKVNGYEIIVDGKTSAIGDSIGRILAPDESPKIKIIKGAAASERNRQAQVAWQRGMPISCLGKL